jgi:predicted esterase
MRTPPRLLDLFSLLSVVAALASRPALAEEEPAAPASAEPLRAGGDEHKRYFLVGPEEGETAPERGYALLLVLPGGDGSASFRPFVERIRQHAVGRGFLQAQLVAVRWREDQEIVWPTARARTPGMAFTTEEFIAAVVADVASRHEIDKQRVYALSWSSSGPACYAASLAPRTPIQGALVAMSVFKPDQLPSLSRARGRAFYLLHSPEDRVCPFRMAEEARERLRKAGARVELASYEGGHGWHGDVFGMIRRGLAWLEDDGG